MSLRISVVIPENSVPQSSVKYRSNVQSDHRRQERQHGKSHNQRLQHRHSHYPRDERESHYEQLARQRMDYGMNTYGEFGRPGSRSGITESVPFTHYVNYNELQTRISRKETLSDSQIVQMRLQVQQQRLKVEEESRKQHQYHSQRQPRGENADNQLRPVSNFYEYESVQSILNTQGGSSSGSNVHISPAQQLSVFQDVNSNSLPRHQQINTRQHISRNYPHQQHRGPFVTQVTIGEHLQPNGTKV